MGIMRTTKATRTKTKTRTRSNVQECDGVVVVCNELSTQNEDEDVDEDDEGNENGDKNGERSARMRSRCATARTCCRWLPSPALSSLPACRLFGTDLLLHFGDDREQTGPDIRVRLAGRPAELQRLPLPCSVEGLHSDSKDCLLGPVRFDWKCTTKVGPWLTVCRRGGASRGDMMQWPGADCSGEECSGHHSASRVRRTCARGSSVLAWSCLMVNPR